MSEELVKAVRFKPGTRAHRIISQVIDEGGQVSGYIRQAVVRYPVLRRQVDQLKAALAERDSIEDQLMALLQRMAERLDALEAGGVVANGGTMQKLETEIPDAVRQRINERAPRGKRFG